MSTKTPYTEKLLKSSRDAGYLKMSRVPAKEYYETADVFRKGITHVLKTQSMSRFNVIYDFCASHGFNIVYTLARNKAKYGPAIDIHPSKASRRLWSYYPRLSARMNYRQENIYKTEYNLEDNSLVLAIHPCRNLCNIVVNIAIKNSLPIVVSPCCIGKQKNSLVSKFNDISPYTRWCINVAEPLQDAGYNIHVKQIRRSVTPVNNIIIGIPN